MAFSRLRRTSAVLIALVAATALTGACGSGSDNGGSSGALDAPGADVLQKASGKTTVEFWHGMKGANATAIDKLVADFNAQSDKVTVKAVFQGDYDQTIAKYKASVQQKKTPDLV